MSITSILLKALVFKAKRFEESTKDPVTAQRRTLFKYLARNRNTEYGLKYNFSGIKSVDEFRSRVPLSDYESVRPYVDRMANGENNILTSDKVTFFGITSGTTGKPKLIPETKYSRQRNSDLMDLWAYYACRDHPHIFDGKTLGIVSPEVKSNTEGGIPYGPEDGRAYNNLPDPVKGLYALPYEVFYIDDYDARYYCMLRLAIEYDVTNIATLNPSTLVILCQRIKEFQGGIIEDIEKGSLNSSFNISPEIRSRIEKNLKPNPKRAKELKDILRQKKELSPKYFWPRMELIECWKGGTVKLYIKQLGRYFGDIAVRDFGCLSTEARSSVPMSDKGAGGVLAINTNFYEFVPVEDIDKKDKRTLMCDELKEGGEYLLVVTTAGGLCRYNIDDVVVVDGFFNKTPVIEFVQKGLNAVSLTGEKIYESHVNEAVNKACDKTGTMIRTFSAFADKDDGPRYVFLVEFDGNPPKEEKRKFLKAIECELCLQNSEYDDIRKQSLLMHPALKAVKKGDFERYRKEKIRRGAHDTQFKLPKLSREFDFEKNFKIEEEIYLDK